jgi:hypothetical protein
MRHLHLMDGADSIQISGPVPPNLSAGSISHRRYTAEVAGPASYSGMKIVRDLFVMGLMALPAVPRLLIAVSERRGLGVTDQTVNIHMRCRGISCFINQRK